MEPLTGLIPRKRLQKLVSENRVSALTPETTASAVPDRNRSEIVKKTNSFYKLLSVTHPLRSPLAGGSAVCGIVTSVKALEMISKKTFIYGHNVKIRESPYRSPRFI